jgi:hypothetical protein
VDQLKVGLSAIYRQYKSDITLYAEEDCRYLMPQLMNELKAFLKYPCVQEVYNKTLILLDEYANRNLFKGLYHNLLKDIKLLIGD